MNTAGWFGVGCCIAGLLYLTVAVLTGGRSEAERSYDDSEQKSWLAKRLQKGDPR